MRAHLVAFVFEDIFLLPLQVFDHFFLESGGAGVRPLGHEHAQATIGRSDMPVRMHARAGVGGAGALWRGSCKLLGGGGEVIAVGCEDLKRRWFQA